MAMNRCATVIWSNRARTLPNLCYPDAPCGPGKVLIDPQLNLRFENYDSIICANSRLGWGLRRSWRKPRLRWRGARWRVTTRFSISFHVCATLAELLQLKPESVRAKKPRTKLEAQVSMMDNVWYAYIKFFSFANIHPRWFPILEAVVMGLLRPPWRLPPDSWANWTKMIVKRLLLECHHQRNPEVYL